MADGLEELSGHVNKRRVEEAQPRLRGGVLVHERAHARRHLFNDWAIYQRLCVWSMKMPRGCGHIGITFPVGPAYRIGAHMSPGTIGIASVAVRCARESPMERARAFAVPQPRSPVGSTRQEVSSMLKTRSSGMPLLRCMRRIFWAKLCCKSLCCHSAWTPAPSRARRRQRWPPSAKKARAH